MIRSAVIALLTALACMAGCDNTTPANRPTTQPAGRQVVVYTALDRNFSEPILQEFTKRTGIEVLAQYDTESTKTVGLTNRIRAESTRPRCDVFWNNEIVNTLALKAEGLLAPCKPAEAANYPEMWRDPEGYWYGFAARARVILVNTKLVTDPAFPKSIHDLADPTWRGKTAIAKPLFGTTATHVACLYATLGEEKTTQYLDSLKQNDVQILGGNKRCAIAVAEGTAAFALTDTDDGIEEIESGKSVRIAYPDNGPDGMGTLFIPNTLAVLKNAPHPEQAVELINYLLSAEVEQKLAAGPSAQIPLNRNGKPTTRVLNPSNCKPMPADFAACANKFKAALTLVESRFLK